MPSDAPPSGKWSLTSCQSGLTSHPFQESAEPGRPAPLLRICRACRPPCPPLTRQSDKGGFFLFSKDRWFPWLSTARPLQTWPSQLSPHSPGAQCGAGSRLVLATWGCF